MPTSAVSWVEFDSSPRITANRDRIVAERNFKVAWSDVEAFASELLFSGPRSGPQQFPGFANLFVDEVRIDPFIANPQGGSFTDPESSNSTHDDAAVKVTYSPLTNYDDLDPGETTPPSDGADKQPLPDGTWAEYQLEFSGEFVELPSRVLIYNSDSTQVAPDSHPTILLPTTDHVVTWHQVSWPPWAAISASRGCVNKDEHRLVSTHQRVSPECLLFVGSSANRVFKRNGTNGWNLTYRFRERAIKGLANFTTRTYDPLKGGAVRLGFDQTDSEAIGWNHIYRDGKTPGWDKPKDPSSGQFLYETADFAELFQYEEPE